MAVMIKRRHGRKVLVRMWRNWYSHTWRGVGVGGKEHGAASGKQFDGSSKTETWNDHMTQQLHL